MLIIEIENLGGNGVNGIGTCGEGEYRYAVKVNRLVIAEGTIKYDRTKHWSLLLRKIAEDGRDRLFKQVMGVTVEEFNKQQPEKFDDLPL